ncbi:hypothetical protein [Thermus sp.]|uniref:hypothetical protein n=1 Tax=Thermus sp. TaxID=275 RepID=UPI0025D39B00|nr:hypothetical protein [Thermus sp.]MCS6869305.1 hypothetical protein [Thermus sp.]MDW8358858.1 hypothetical protein [Thermus sp.]
MSSAPSSWTIRAKPRFGRDLKRLAKDLYKSKGQREKFKAFVEGIYDLLEQAGPFHPKLDAKLMSLGSGQLPQGCQLFKLYLRPPETRGESGEMRIIALACPSLRTVELLMAYTHADYAKQPSDQEILARMREEEA